MVEHFMDMVAGSLRLMEPWYVESAKFDPEAKRVDIYIGVREDAAIPCPSCGSPTSRYGYEPQERVWRHGDCMFFPTYVHCKRPKVKCPKCGVEQISAPFERKNSRFTTYFEGYAMMLMADMPRAKAAKLLRCDEKSMASILSYWVNKAVDARSLADLRKLGIDETSFKRGHDYVTLVIDAVGRCVVDVEEGREKETIARFSRKLKAKGGDAANITAVSSDMSKTYGPAIEENFPNAEHVIDKFHVKQVLTNAMEAVRKEEQKDVQRKKDLFRNRYLFMRPKSKLTAEQATSIATLSKRFPKTGKAFRIVASLDDFYASQNIEEAESAFKRLYSWMRRCRLKPMKDAAQTLSRHQSKILAYFRERLTNAICEGINAMVQAAKRKARGYHTFEGYSAMIYLVAGKLDLATPNPFRHFH